MERLASRPFSSCISVFPLGSERPSATCICLLAAHRRTVNRGFWLHPSCHLCLCSHLDLLVKVRLLCRMPKVLHRDIKPVDLLQGANSHLLVTAFSQAVCSTKMRQASLPFLTTSNVTLQILYICDPPWPDPAFAQNASSAG